MYDGSKPLGNRFGDVAKVVCARKPDLLYFAGRGVHLTKLIRSLRYRPCDSRLTVMSGDDAAQLRVDDEVAAALSDTGSRELRVLYTGLSHPAAWTDDKTSGADGYRLFEEIITKALGDSDVGRDEFNDGFAIMNHDAVLAAVAAIRTQPAKHPQGVHLPTKEEVVQNLAGLHDGNAIRGASGIINIDGRTGEPINKLVVVLRWNGDGTVSFVEASWPDGRPDPR